MSLAELIWPYRRFLLLVPAVVLLAAASTAVEAEWAAIEPAKGVFLVAKPRVPGTFRETVILLLAHSKEDGTIGVIINRTTNVTLSEALPDLEVEGEPSHQLFFGGPVAMNAHIVLFRTGNPPEGAPHVMWDVYFSGERDVLEELLKRQKGANEMHIFMGYAGWGPGQLQWEINRGDWELARGDRETLFEKEPDLIWPELMLPFSQQVAD